MAEHKIMRGVVLHKEASNSKKKRDVKKFFSATLLIFPIRLVYSGQSFPQTSKN